MRKAFDANVPKLRPRLKTGVPAAVAESVAEVPTATPTANVNENVNVNVNAAVRPEPVEGRTPTATRKTTTSTSTPTTTSTSTSMKEDAPAPATDVHSRRERLEKIKRKVAEAARPQPRVHPIPADPARAAESVLGLVRDLEAELVRAREREEALRGDLDDSRRELSRAATEGRTAVERLDVTEKELEEKRSVLSDLLGEMQALEEERDESVRRAQALAALDEERAKLLEDLGRRADEETRLRAEREAEVERLSEELRFAGTEGARLRAAVGELARERDTLGADLDLALAERDELAEAKKALEAVHAALSQARARIA
ncbi:MAG TPA: hypothetical protein VF875_09185 [Anaeromyxobacter sp.]